jgi:xanthine dehydrogenase accessory factor
VNRHSRHWSEAVREYEARNCAYVIVTVLGARGSTPRDSGTKMVVAREDFHGTIGGGELEHRALARAQALLGDRSEGQWVENYPLGEKLGQCCGGSASLLYECYVPVCPAVYLFGAGHVGRALTPILAALPLRVHWIDSRDQEFPEKLPTGVRRQQPDNPVDSIPAAAPQSYFLIMTHQHPLDFALLEAVLRRDDAAYIGVIGSESKWRRFRLRLQHRGYTDATINRIRCPIGLPTVSGKQPAEIAVSVAAELIAHYQARRSDATVSPGPGWKTLREQLRDTGLIPDDTEHT